MNTNKLLFGVAESASYNVLIQVFFRIQTFVLNGFIIRYISNDVLGIINVRLLLLYSTITFLSTESFRQACITNPKSHDWRQVINLMWLMIPVCMLISISLGFVWIEFLERPDASLFFQYTVAVWMIVFSCILERIAEPLLIISQIYLFNKLPAVARSVSITSHYIILAATVYFSPQYAIVGFAIGQVVRSLLFVVIFYLYFYHYFQKESFDNFKGLGDFLPQIIADKANFNRELGGLTWSFFKQGILKQILTEGERYMMTAFNILNFAEQGVYDVVSNLGSLAARFIFRPIEESSYHYFAQSLSRENVKENQSNESIEMGATVLQHLLKVMVLLGLVIVCFGYSYSYLLLHLYGGNLLSSGSGPLLMRWQCVYVLMIAVNGITECFAFATMGKKDIDRFNFIMILISVVFLSLAWYLTRLFSAVGFILANCANMLCRICHSVLFIKKFFQGTPYTPLSGLFPHPIVLGAIGCSYFITSTSEVMFCCRDAVHIVLHISIGMFCLMLVGLSIFVSEKELIMFVKNEWEKRKALKHE